MYKAGKWEQEMGTGHCDTELKTVGHSSGGGHLILIAYSCKVYTLINLNGAWMLSALP